MAFSAPASSSPSSQGYTLGEKLGAGQFGTVYKARNRNNAICALKSIDISASATSEWKREIQALKKVSGHANVVEMRNFFISSGTLWIEMEFCNGGTLNDYVIEKKPSNAIKHQLIVEMSSGVAFLHSRGITHRDLKPDNIMINIVSAQPHAKVADFGLAKPYASLTLKSELYQYYLQTNCGTPLFMAPEVYQNHYTEKADVFSLGVIFRSMVPGVKIISEGGKQYLAILHEGCALGDWMKDTRQSVVFASHIRIGGNAKKLLDAMISFSYANRPSAANVKASLQTIPSSEFSK